MAIVQISRIQHRRGLQQDLPQLASAELGWSIDKQRLFIGNGTLLEQAPQEGITEILTTNSINTAFLSFINSYIFAGTDAGYTSQTGATVATPTARSLQSVLDEQISVKDFGAVGNGIADDTVAIQRAISEVYTTTLNTIYAPVRRTIKFPAGTYNISTANIRIPPNCTLVGDGKNNTIIINNTGNVFVTCDSKFQLSTDVLNFGLSGAVLPSNISVTGMTLSTTWANSAAVTMTSASDMQFDNCLFDGNINAGGTGTSIRITNSTIYGAITPVILAPTVTGFVSQNNYYPEATVFPINNLSGNNYSIGDTFGTTSLNAAGLYSGNAKIGTAKTISLSSGSNTITTLATGSGTMDYQINDGSTNYRFGTLKYNKTATTLTFDDEYSEPASALTANLFIFSNAVVTCSTTATGNTLKYNIKQFI